jgi:glycosyltransferase involved in cell wall biosynthesis
MRILCLSDAFWPDHTGGISKSLLTKIEGLVELGHSVSVVCRRLKNSHPNQEERDGYRVYRYAGPAKGSAFYRLYPFASMVELPRFLRRMNGLDSFDVAYTNDLFQVAGLKRALPGLPYVHNYHASAVAEINLDASRGKYGVLSPTLKIVLPFIAAIERQGLLNASYSLVDSQFMCRDMLQRYETIDKNRIRHIPLAVDTIRFSPAKDLAATREGLELPLDRPILLTVRRLVARMGIDNLIAAMSLVARDVPDALLLVGGMGYLADHLRETIHNLHLERNVHLLGFIPEDALPRYYQAADLFVLPTLDYEGFGLVTIESLACGTPVLATPVGATPEILNPLEPGLLFAGSNPAAMAAGTLRWLHRGISQEFRRQCRAYCETRFAKATVCRQLESILAAPAG